MKIKESKETTNTNPLVEMPKLVNMNENINPPPKRSWMICLWHPRTEIGYSYVFSYFFTSDKMGEDLFDEIHDKIIPQAVKELNEAHKKDDDWTDDDPEDFVVASMTCLD